jgi:hypothetical protein
MGIPIQTTFADAILNLSIAEQLVSIDLVVDVSGLPCGKNVASTVYLISGIKLKGLVGKILEEDVAKFAAWFRWVH